MCAFFCPKLYNYLLWASRILEQLEKSLSFERLLRDYRLRKEAISFISSIIDERIQKLEIRKYIISPGIKEGILKRENLENVYGEFEAEINRLKKLKDLIPLKYNYNLENNSK